MIARFAGYLLPYSTALMQRRTRLILIRLPLEDWLLETHHSTKKFEYKQLEINSQIITRQSLDEFPFCR